jgi:hypothetical protein
MPRLAPLILTAVIAIAPLRPAIAQPPAEDLAALAARIAGPDAPPVERAGRLVAWINTEFAWTTTDYERRTVDDIIRRRGGNCAELSRVLARLLDLSGIQYRTVREINIQPESAQRQANAEERVRTAGLRMSVFGRTHNDHVWLEVADGRGGWIPADPSVGTVGLEEWIAARAALRDRRPPAISAAAGIVANMLVPIAVVVVSPAEDRSEAYLVRGLDAAYGGSLSALPAWRTWVERVRAFAPVAQGAFEGRLNLHEHVAAIDALGEAYRELQQQWRPGPHSRALSNQGHGPGVRLGSDPAQPPAHARSTPVRGKLPLRLQARFDDEQAGADRRMPDAWAPSWSCPEIHRMIRQREATPCTLSRAPRSSGASASRHWAGTPSRSTVFGTRTFSQATG